MARESLTLEEAEATLGSVLAGEATPAQIGAFLTLLRAKGETTDEVTGLSRAMVEAAVPLTLPVGPDAVVDLVGTGGDRLSSINVTTLAALVVAGCGVVVCKHGGRSASSSVGSADVLESLDSGAPQLRAINLRDALVGLAEVVVDTAAEKRLRNGDSRALDSQVPSSGPLFKVISEQGDLIAVARATSRVTAIVERIFNLDAAQQPNP